MALRDVSEVETVAGDFNDGLDHPEGVTWGPDGQLYAGGEAGQIYRVDPNSGAITQIAQHEGFLGGVACDAEANVYVCAAFGGAVVRAGADGSVVEVTRGTADRPMETPNYPCFHPSGDLYVSDSGEWDHDTGRIYRVRPDGSTDLVSEAPRYFANGMCFDAGGRVALRRRVPDARRQPPARAPRRNPGRTPCRRHSPRRRARRRAV